MVFKGSFQAGASCDSVRISIHKCSSWSLVTICNISMWWTLITWRCDGYDAQLMSRKNTKFCCYQHGFLSEGRSDFNFWYWAFQGGSQRSLWTMSHYADTVKQPLPVMGTLQGTLETMLDVRRDNLTSHIWEIRFLLFSFLLEQDKC